MYREHSNDEVVKGAEWNIALCYCLHVLDYSTVLNCQGAK